MRNYLDWLLSLPWNELAGEDAISSCQQVLDQDHFGLDKVKDRIVEYLAVTEPSQ